MVAVSNLSAVQMIQIYTRSDSERLIVIVLHPNAANLFLHIHKNVVFRLLFPKQILYQPCHEAVKADNWLFVLFITFGF